MRNADYRIRVATHKDVPTIVALNAALFLEDAGQRDPFMDLEWPNKEGAEYFTSLLSSAETHCLIAESDDEQLGYLIGFVREKSSLRPVRTAELQSMFVKAHSRSLGIGARLVNEFLVWCGGQGVQRVSVTGYVSNEGAIRFYRRMGFEAKELTLERGL